VADGKRIVVKILRCIGKGFCLFGRGIWGFCKLLGRAIKRDYKNYQKRQRIRETEQAYYRQIAREAHAEEVGRQQAIYEYRERDRARRESERAEKAYYKRINQMFARQKLTMTSLSKISAKETQT
jgi:hypothetical protein